MKRQVELYNRKFSGYIRTEVRMKRVKFKPGYSRIWRKSREAINYSLNFNHRYQYHLTRNLNKLQRVTKKFEFRLYDLTLHRLILNSRFVFDLNTSMSLINSNLVYVNGRVSSNPNLYLFVNDFIQIVVSLKYYIVYRWLINWNLNAKLKLNKLSQSKFNQSRFDLSKQKSSHLPDWIFKVGFKNFDIPKYLEVDFFTLSAFFLYEPLSVKDFNPLSRLESRTEILNMYNWKYIN